MTTDLLQVRHVDMAGDFGTQVRNVVAGVRLSRGEELNLKRLFCDLTQALRTFWPGCVVTPLGSTVTGLALKTSDADCHVSIPEQLKTLGDDCIISAKRVLTKTPGIFHQVSAVTGTKVSIVKFLHAPTQRYCDVNFDSAMGVRDTKLITHLLQMDERALPFAVILKYWSMVHKITSKHFPNHAFAMMTIFFLQQVNILPSVVKLQRNVKPEIVDNWNAAFDEKYRHYTNNDQSLYSLLGGFFEYYSTYRFSESIISPYAGISLDRNLFSSLDLVPKEFDLYKGNVREGKCELLETDCVMCVQDPLELDGNSAARVDSDVFGRLLCQVRRAARLYKSCSQDDFLRAILDPINASLID